MNQNKENNPKSRRVLIPIGTPDLDAHFLKPDEADTVRAILGLITLQWIRMKNQPNYAAGLDRAKRYSPVTSNSLKIIAGNHYVKLIHNLESQKWIEGERTETGNLRYTKGKYCGRYRICANVLRKAGTKRKFRLEQITSEKVLSSLDKLRDVANMNLSESQYSKLNNFAHQNIALFTKRLKVDVEKIAEDAVAGLLDEQTAYEWIMFGDDVNRGGHSFKCDEFGHRLHTIATRVPSDLRPYIYFDGYNNENIAILDISCSQPYLASVLLFSPETVLKKIPEFTPIVKLIRDRALSNDVQMFHYLCSENKIYQQWLLASGRIKYNRTIISDKLKRLAKDEFFAFLFSRPGNRACNSKTSHANTKVNNRFKMLFRNCWELLREIKTAPEETLPFMKQFYDRKRDAYRKYKPKSCAYLNLPAMMQRLESVIVREISTRMIEAGIGPFTIIHDSWVVREKDAQLTNEIIAKYFQELAVKPPKIKSQLFNRCGISKGVKKPN